MNQQSPVSQQPSDPQQPAQGSGSEVILPPSTSEAPLSITAFELPITPLIEAADSPSSPAQPDIHNRSAYQQLPGKPIRITEQTLGSDGQSPLTVNVIKIGRDLMTGELLVTRSRDTAEGADLL